jgi:hypothetical protein
MTWKMSKKNKALIIAVVAALVLACLLICLVFKQPPRWQPSVGVYQGVDVVVLEDFVAVEGDRYVVRAAAPERFAQVPAWGGWSVSANITHSTLAVNLTGAGGRGLVLVFGVASRNATLDQDLGNGFRVHASGEGGYVVYNNTAGWCLRPPARQDDVYVWLPAPSCSLSVEYRITVEPAWGGVYVNGRPAEVVNVGLAKVRGVLPGWLVYANQSGAYYFTVRP